jgi:hypothetical protein
VSHYVKAGHRSRCRSPRSSHLRVLPEPRAADAA